MTFSREEIEEARVDAVKNPRQVDGAPERVSDRDLAHFLVSVDMRPFTTRLIHTRRDRYQRAQIAGFIEKDMSQNCFLVTESGIKWVEQTAPRFYGVHLRERRDKRIRQVIRRARNQEELEEVERMAAEQAQWDHLGMGSW